MTHDVDLYSNRGGNISRIVNMQYLLSEQLLQLSSFFQTLVWDL